MDARRQALLDELRPAVADQRVLAAMASVPREAFVPAELRRSAYENRALPIGCGQTISQPLVVARMCELLELAPGDRVLEIGAGSGYHAAVMAALCAHVDTVEIHEELAHGASGSLAAAGITNVDLFVGDGSHGLASGAPYDAISVAAATPAAILPELEAQLAEGGRLVAPVVSGPAERLVLARRRGDHVDHTALDPVRFVPLARDG